MRIKLSALLLFTASVTVLSSCVKSPEQAPDVPGSSTVKGLTVPAGFNWATSVTVQCRFTAPHQAKVYVALPGASDPFASFLVGGDADPVALNIPVAVRSLYVTYEKKDGTLAGTSLPVSGTSLSYAVPVDSKEYVLVNDDAAQAFLAAPVTKADDPDRGYITYPASGWGTLMFEDLWPSYGDYDFNDFVANYKIELIPQNKNLLYQMLLSVRVQAIGGSMPYDFYLGLNPVGPDEISKVEQIRNFNGAATNTMELVNANDKNPAVPAIFQFKDIQKNANAPQGVAFMNTSKGGEMKKGDLVEAVYLVTFRNAVAVNRVPFEAFDFFIARGDQQKEIHAPGFAPAFYGPDVYTAFSTQPTSNANQSTRYYYSNDNLLWALNVPEEIPHAYEGTDFLVAYPNFAKWAKSGGTQNQDWYTGAAGNRVGENLVALQ